MAKRAKAAGQGGRPPAAAAPAIPEGLILGDCLAGMTELPDGCAALVTADPPFNIGRAYDACDDDRPAAEYLAWTAAWAAEAARILAPTGSLFVCCSEEFVHELKVVVEGRFALDCGAGPIRRGGPPLAMRHEIIWHYTFGVNAPRKLTRSHTTILHFVRSLERHAWHPEDARVPSARQLEYGDKRANPAGRLPDDTWMIRPASARAAGFLAPGQDVWEAPRVCGTFRARVAVDNQMPEAILGRVIRLTTDPGDLVVSPFAGSGTDLVVARKLGRRHLGWELSPAYHARAAERLAAARPGDPLDGVAADPETRGEAPAPAAVPATATTPEPTP